MAFCQGDVAGKGHTAGLLMALALFRRLAREGLDVDEIAMAINEELFVQSERFVTFAIGWLDCSSGRRGW